MLLAVLGTTGGILAYSQTQRLSVAAGAAAGGLALGLALARLKYRYSTFRRTDEVARVLAVPVLAAVPLMEHGDTPAARRGARFLLRGRSVFAVIGSMAALLLRSPQS